MWGGHFSGYIWAHRILCILTLSWTTETSLKHSSPSISQGSSHRRTACLGFRVPCASSLNTAHIEPKNFPHRSLQSTEGIGTTRPVWDCHRTADQARPPGTTPGLIGSPVAVPDRSCMGYKEHTPIHTAYAAAAALGTRNTTPVTNGFVPQRLYEINGSYWRLSFGWFTASSHVPPSKLGGAPPRSGLPTGSCHCRSGSRTRRRHLAT